MNPFDDEFLARYAAGATVLPADPEATAVIQYLVEGLPGGKRWFYEEVRSGAVTECRAGRHPDPLVTVTWKADAALAVTGGSLSDDEAYMRGDTKVEGAYEVWLDTLHPWRTSTERRALLASLVASCEPA